MSSGINIRLCFFCILNLFLLFLVTRVPTAECHGRLMDPPARNAMWRVGFPNPVNYDDAGLYCGSYAVQWSQNNGKCGICGDAWHEQPRAHEAGGTYANGIIGRRYTPGQTIDIEIDITVNHFGTFEMKLCPNNDPQKLITQECLDEHPLKIIDDRGKVSDVFVIPENSQSGETFFFKAKLPPLITCTQCVIQWKYRTANTWGDCMNGTESVGCGPQETFINCADVSINSNTGGHGPRPISSGGSFSPKNRDNPFMIYYRDYTKAGTPLTPLIVRSEVCVGTGTYTDIPGIDSWCQSNCLKYPPSCPQDKCTCIQKCEAVGSFKDKQGSDQYCMENCLNGSPKRNCPKDKCVCY